MVVKIKSRRLFALAKALAALGAAAALIFYSDGSRQGVRQGVEMCLGVLVPSLFPFMALSSLIANSGLCRALAKPMMAPAKALFALSGATVPVLLLSLIGGYPVGAAGIAALRKQGLIGENEAKHASLFMVCAGPGFLISFVGGGLYNSIKTGLILFAAQTASVVISGIILKIILKENYDSSSEQRTKPKTNENALVVSVYEAARSMAMICAFVLLFSSLTGVLSQIIPDSGLLTSAYILLEVCTAVTHTADRSIALTAFAAGFGGLCVHFQIFSALKGVPVNKALFFLIRIIQGLMTAALARLFLCLFPAATEVFSTSRTGSASFYNGSVLSGAALITVIICFTVVIKQHIGKHNDHKA